MIRIVKFAVVPLILIAGYRQVIASPTLQKAPIQRLGAPQLTTQQTAAPNSSTTKRVYLAGKRVSFVPPPGFTPMTTEEIALKFPKRGGNPPQHVYANERRSVSVAITFSPAQISPEQLPELKNFLPKFLELAIPESKWITQDFAVINNIRWVQLEFISRAIDTKIHNDAYFTSFDGKMLGFNFNSTVEQYDAVSAELRKSRNSINISQ